MLITEIYSINKKHYNIIRIPDQTHPVPENMHEEGDELDEELPENMHEGGHELDEELPEYSMKKVMS